MYINRTLITIFGVLLVFFPTIQEWLFNPDAPWYRPYQPWLLLILAAYWNQRTRLSDEL